MGVVLKARQLNHLVLALIEALYVFFVQYGLVAMTLAEQVVLQIELAARQDEFVLAMPLYQHLPADDVRLSLIHI